MAKLFHLAAKGNANVTLFARLFLAFGAIAVLTPMVSAQEADAEPPVDEVVVAEIAYPDYFQADGAGTEDWDAIVWQKRLTVLTDQCWENKRTKFASVCWSACKQATDKVADTNLENTYSLSSAQKLTKRCADFYNRFATAFREDSSNK